MTGVPPTTSPTTVGELADRLLDVVDGQLAALAAGPLPGLALPRMLLGHPVGADVRADLLFTVGWLHAAGRSHVGGDLDAAEVLTRALAGVRGRRTHSFYSYRVAETVERFGPLDPANPLLAPLTGEQREQVRLAVDTTEWIDLLDQGVLPRNYAAVLARCEHARRRLGIEVDDAVLAGLLDRVRALLGGHLDDSNTRIGRYDVYTVDIHLFCEPFAADLGAGWRDGARAALDLVDRVAGPDGAAVPWGRSTGVLALCHTIELAGLVARHDLGAGVDPGRWYARAAAAASRLDEWFLDGWVTAHRYRASDPYRGLDRRLQMTLDCLGKLAETAAALRPVAGTHVPEVDLFPDRDEVVRFDRVGGHQAAVWSYRDRRTAFVVPLVGATTTDYLPAPRNPGLFEVPVGNDLATATPVLLHGDVRYAAGGAPVAVAAGPGPGRLTVRYDGFPEVGQLERGDDARTFPGTREVTWRVEGRTLHAEERLRFDLDRLPHGLAVQVAEAADRPLRFSADADAPHTVATVDVDGIAEYRSCWGELPRLHQVDVEPAASVRLRWSVTPVLRVVSTAAGHHYSDSLYEPLADRVRVERLGYGTANDPGRLRDLLARTDQFHLHWPEWLPLRSGRLESHERCIAALRAAGVRIVWTMHNLVPHTKDPAAGPVYEAWADAADLVLHHSRWGCERARATYRYAAGTRHVVVPHGHFGAGTGAGAATPAADGDGPIRIGIVGAPRAEKDVELAMRAVARCGRPDVELHVHSLQGDEVVPDDPRIVVAEAYSMVPRGDYDEVLRGLDALLMPFDPDGDMLTTGTVGDAVGFGLPTIASSWPYLAEALGDAAVTYGRTEDDLVACLDGLDRAALARSAAAAVALRAATSWPVVAEATYRELDDLGSTHH